MLARSCARLSSRISVPIPLPAHNPCSTSWRRTLDLRLLSIIASTTFHINPNRPIPWMSVFPFGIRTRIFHPSSLGISLCLHINWVISTRLCHLSVLGGVEVPSDEYSSRSHLLKCSVRRCVWPPALWSWRCRTSASTPSPSPYEGT